MAGGSRGRRPAAMATALALLAGCGQAPTAGIGVAAGAEQGEGGGDVSVGEIAPPCEDLDLMARPAFEVPDGVTATGTGGYVEAPAGGGGGTSADVDRQLEDWGRREAPASFGGVWADPAIDGFVVGFATDVETYAARIRAEVHPGVGVATVPHPRAELERIAHELAPHDDLSLDDAPSVDTAEPGTPLRASTSIWAGVVEVLVFDPDDTHLAALTERYGADRLCFEIQPAPRAPVDGIRVLAKTVTRAPVLDDLTGEPTPLRLIDDRDTAERAWADTVPDELPSRDDPLPAEPGRYGDLADVDFDRELVLVWSDGQSGTCPGWIVDVRVEDGRLAVEGEASGGPNCTHDYVSYRLLLAVDRDRLPPVDDLLGMPIRQVYAHGYGDESREVVRPYPEAGS